MYSSTLLFLNIGGPEMILIFLVVLLLFGGKKLPELARGLGKGLREFKDASDGIKREIHNNINSVSEVASDIEKEVQSSVSTISETDVSPETYKPVSDPELPETVVPETELPETVITEQTKIAH